MVNWLDWGGVSGGRVGVMDRLGIEGDGEGDTTNPIPALGVIFESRGINEPLITEGVSLFALFGVCAVVESGSLLNDMIPLRSDVILLRVELSRSDLRISWIETVCGWGS